MDYENDKTSISDLYGVIAQILTNFYTTKQLFRRFYFFYLKNKRTTNIQKELTSYIVSLYFDLSVYEKLKNDKDIKIFFEFVKKNLLKENKGKVEANPGLQPLNYGGLVFCLDKINKAINVLGLSNIAIVDNNPGRAITRF